jgi:hypothetical protein
MRLFSIFGVTDRGILSQHVNIIISALLKISLFLIIVNYLMYLDPLYVRGVVDPDANVTLVVKLVCLPSLLKRR